MNAKKIVVIIVGFFALLLVSAGIFLATFDVDKYRGNIVDILGKQTGRTITLKGPIKLGFSSSGLSLSITDASIGNPPWSARAAMAGIGKFELGVAFLPLLAHQLEVTNVTIANADIELETSPNNQHNWDFEPAAGTPKPASDGKTIAKQTSSSGDVAISLRKLSITDSQLAIRAADGKITAFKAKNLSFTMSGGQLALTFEGDDDGTPINVKLKADTSDIMANKDWPFNLSADYAVFHVQANGTANLVSKKANIASYVINAGKTELHGQMQAGWATPKPRLQGNLAAGKLDLADFKRPEKKGATATGETSGEPAAKSRHVLSDAPLDLGALKSLDAAIDFGVAEFPAGDTSLTQISGKINLAGGQLDLPFKAKLGNGDLNGKVAVNAASATPQMAVAFTAPSLALTDAFKAAKLPAFISDTANIQINLSGAGNSLNAIASNANGVINIIGGTGKIAADAAGMLGSGLAMLFTPSGSSNALECLAARFIVTNGLVKDNGILIDTAPTTIVGKGGFNLRDETNDLTLHAKTKMVNVGGVLPPVHIGGSFAHPGFSADAGAIVQNVVGMLTSGSLASDIPDVKGPAGQNACLYMIDHPSAATSSSNPIVPTNAGAAKIKDVGNQLMRGLFGK